MTVPYDLIDLAALDLTSELGKENALTATISSVNSILTVLNNAGSSVPLLGAGNTGGLLTASQKLVLTGGGNADLLHTHSGLSGGGGVGGTQAFLIVGGDPSLANARSLIGVSGEISVNDFGPGAWEAIGLVTTGVVAGAYTRVTVDVKGRITNGGTLLSTDLPVHTHNASDINAGTIAAARFGATTVPMSAINPGAGTDGWLVTKSGTALVLSAAPSGTGEVNTASNVGIAGSGLFRRKTGPNLEFYNIEGLNGVLAAIDTPNLAISLQADFGTNTNQVSRGDHTHDTRYYQKSEVDNLVKGLAVVTKSNSYTATAADQYIRVDTTSGNWTITLPDAATNIGKVLYVKRTNVSTLFAATVTVAGTDKIDGVYTSWILRDRNEFVEFVAVAGNWEVINASGTSVPVVIAAIGSASTFSWLPTAQHFKATATVNGGNVTIAGVLTGQTIHIELLSGAGGFATNFIAGSGMGSIRWAGGVFIPPTTTIANKIDEVYGTFNGTDLIMSFRGQGF